MANQDAKAPAPDMENRGNSRFPVNVIVHGDSNQALPLMFSRDISLGGIAIETGDKLPENFPLVEGKELCLTFALPFGSQFLRVNAKVVWIREQVKNFDGGFVTVFGLAFLSPEPMVYEEIERYTSRLAGRAAATSASTPAQQPEAEKPVQPVPIQVVDVDQPSQQPAEEAAMETTESPQAEASVDNFEQPILDAAIISEDEIPSSLIESQTLPEQAVEEESAAPTIQTHPIEHYMKQAKALNLMAAAPTGNSEAAEIHRIVKTMLPKERNALLGEEGLGEVFQKAAALLLKFAIEQKKLQQMSQAFEDSEAAIQTVVDEFNQLSEQVIEECRAHVNELYQQAKANDGQLLNQLINKIDTANRSLADSLEITSQETSVLQDIEIKPIKYYYEQLGKAAQGTELPHDDDESPNIELLEKSFYIWEIRAFLANDPYWQREERAVMAAVVSLAMKFKEEADTFKALFDADKHIVDEVTKLYKESQHLLAKVERKVRPVLNAVVANKDITRQGKISKSFEKVRDAFSSIKEIAELSQKSIEMISDVANKSANQKLYKDAFAKEQQKPAEKKGRKKKSKVKSSASNKAKIIASSVMMAVAIVIFALQMPKILSNLQPSVYENPEYQKILNYNKTESWGDWIFVTINDEDWNAIPKEQQLEKATALLERIKKDGFQSLEIKNSQGKQFAMTVKRGEETFLRVY